MQRGPNKPPKKNVNLQAIIKKKEKEIFLNSKALNSTNQEQIIEESKVGPNSDLVPFYVLFREVEKKKKAFLNSKALKNTTKNKSLKKAK
jgi:hypothetical protein